MGLSAPKQLFRPVRTQSGETRDMQQMALAVDSKAMLST